MKFSIWNSLRSVGGLKDEHVDPSEIPSKWSKEGQTKMIDCCGAWNKLLVFGDLAKDGILTVKKSSESNGLKSQLQPGNCGVNAADSDTAICVRTPKAVSVMTGLNDSWSKDDVFVPHE